MSWWQWALLVVGALGGFYCLLRWTTSAPTTSASTGRHRASGGGHAERRPLIAEQTRAGDAAQDRMRAAVARETGGAL